MSDNELGPFATQRNPITGEWVGAVDARSRIEMVKTFDAQQCRDALKLPDLQTTVINALERRLRELNRG